MTDPRIREFIRLFNREEFFDAHEVLEDLWQEYPAPDRRYLQGLIQIAVALEHRQRGNLRGARGVLTSARRNLEDYLPRYGGFDLAELLEGASARIEGFPAHPAPRLPLEQA